MNSLNKNGRQKTSAKSTSLSNSVPRRLNNSNPLKTLNEAEVFDRNRFDPETITSKFTEAIRTTLGLHCTFSCAPLFRNGILLHHHFGHVARILKVSQEGLCVGWPIFFAVMSSTFQWPDLVRFKFRLLHVGGMTWVYHTHIVPIEPAVAVQEKQFFVSGVGRPSLLFF